MRRVWVVAVATAAVFGTTACTDAAPAAAPQPSVSATASGGATPPATTAPPSPGDPAATNKGCASAATIMSTGTKFFNDRITELEKAAAKGDQQGMVAAAEAINKRFTEMGTGLSALARTEVSSGLKTALTKGAAALTEIPSASYGGVTSDIRKRLADIKASLDKACH